MHKARLIIFILVVVNTLTAQLIPADRLVDWSLAGVKDSSTIEFEIYSVGDFGFISDGLTPNDEAFQELLDQLDQDGAKILFDSGTYLFNSTIHLNSNIILKGKGADQTELVFNLGGNGNAIDVRGKLVKSDTFWLDDLTMKNDQWLKLENSNDLNPGDWLRIFQDDVDLVTSSWAIGTVGQILQIEAVSDDSVSLKSPLRSNFDQERNPYAFRIEPVEQVGIECLKIRRLDDTAPMQSSSVHFSYVVNSWVNGVESENCTFSHVEAEYSSNIKISNSYFHHAFDYGGGGRAYGVMLHLATNECLVENNVFEHLRHSMIVQAGANGNVFAYNYSFDPFWSSFPSNSAGDAVLHGNYVHSNLFEQNIIQNIVIDNSHGPNGPHNTFFRNRVESYGIFFSANNSPSQNIIGNEITNVDFPFNLVNYTIQGQDHFLYGNNNKGSVVPPNTDTIDDQSLFYKERPAFVSLSEWGSIGVPNELGAGTIPSNSHFIAGDFISLSCDQFLSSLDYAEDDISPLIVYPNPSSNILSISSIKSTFHFIIYDSLGRQKIESMVNNDSVNLDISNWGEGVYYIFLLENGVIVGQKAMMITR